MKRIRWVVLAAFVVLLVGGMAWRYRSLGRHSVTLTWEAPPPVQEVVVAGYNVYRRERPESGYVRVASRIRDRQYQDHLVRSGATYFYVVTTVDQAGRESRFSRELSVAIP